MYGNETKYVCMQYIYMLHYMHVYYTSIFICVSNFQVGIFMTDILSKCDQHINKRPLRTWKVHFIVRRFVFQFCRWASEPHNHQWDASGATGATEGVAFKKWRGKKNSTTKQSTKHWTISKLPRVLRVRKRRFLWCTETSNSSMFTPAKPTFNPLVVRGRMCVNLRSCDQAPNGWTKTTSCLRHTGFGLKKFPLELLISVTNLKLKCVLLDSSSSSHTSQLVASATFAKNLFPLAVAALMDGHFHRMSLLSTMRACAKRFYAVRSNIALFATSLPPVPTWFDSPSWHPNQILKVLLQLW